VRANAKAARGGKLVFASQLECRDLRKFLQQKRQEQTAELSAEVGGFPCGQGRMRSQHSLDDTPLVILFPFAPSVSVVQANRVVASARNIQQQTESLTKPNLPAKREEYKFGLTEL